VSVNRRALTAAFTGAAQRRTRDRGALALTLAFYVLVTLVLVKLWQGAAEARGGSIVGYSALALTWYAATTEASTISLSTKAIEDIGNDIASGTITTELLRPVSVLAVRVSDMFGRALVGLVVCVSAGAVLATLLAGPPPSMLGAALAVPALALGLLCNICALHAFAAVAFWMREVRSAWFIYQKGVFLLGGMLLPLEVLPPALETVARLLPFAAMSYVPGRLAAGYVEPGLLALQVFWIAAMGAVATLTFRAGERRLQVVGG
jgi:ABC-2 type transport system permease protein